MMFRSLSSSRLVGSSGMTLIEVLVAIFVISFGLLGVAALQMTSLKNNHSAYYRSVATVLASDMLDRMRVNKKAAIGGGYDTGGAFKDCSNSYSDSTMQGKDMNDWLGSLCRRLPSGKGKINAAAGANSFQVVVQWDDQRGSNADGAGAKELVIETQGCANDGCSF